MTAQHTAGKWYVEGSNPPRIYANQGMDIICECDSHGEMTQGLEKANAALIVSAVNNTAGIGINPEAVPLLLEALERLLAYVPIPAVTMGAETSNPFPLPDYIVQARAALSKARGQS